MRLVALTILVFLVAVEGTACGGGSAAESDITITVGSKGTTEEEILGEIYAQALEAAGFRVKRKLQIPAGPPPFDREKLHISGYPEHLNIALKDILQYKGDVPGNSAQAYTIAKEGLAIKGLTAFPPTSFSRSKAVGMLKKTARARDLKTLSDLSGQAEQMSVMAGDFCGFLTDCLVGLKRFYGISFEAFTAVRPALRYKVLEDGKTDTSMLLSTEGRLAGKRGKFVILKDDKHRLPAGNVFWLTTTEIAEAAGPAYEKALIAAQKGLTLKAMQRLDAEVELEDKLPAEVARRYLKSIDDGIVRGGNQGL